MAVAQWRIGPDFKPHENEVHETHTSLFFLHTSKPLEKIARALHEY
eukprot:COSAG05_NODE_180_length_14817_cov_423.925262_14_plen_46_part_00